uniref:VP4 n=1 Tax=Grass carp reovirus TaxID=128987 RepID=M1SZ32_GCRV|nr:VP4 [Grass carp reovirus]
MGNVQTNNTTVNINGDGNSFGAESGMRSTAAPEIMLSPGKLNPNGLAWMKVAGSGMGPGSLQIVHATDGSPYCYIPPDAMSSMEKSAGAVNLWEPLFAAIFETCSTVNVSDFTDEFSAYVGVSEPEALKKYIEKGVFMSTSQAKNFFGTLGQRMARIKGWSEDIRTAAAMIPVDTPHGSVTCDWKSLLRFWDENLPVDNVCKQYQNAVYEVALKIYPALRAGNSGSLLSDVVGVLSGGAAGTTASGVSMVEGVTRNEQVSRILTSADVDILTSSAPVPVSALRTPPVELSYQPSALSAKTTPWLVRYPGTTAIEKTFDVGTTSKTTYYLSMGNSGGGDLMIDLKRLPACGLEYSLRGIPIIYDTNLTAAKLAKVTPALLMLQTAKPLSAEITAADIQAIAPLVVGTDKLNTLVTTGFGNIRNITDFSMSAIWEPETVSAAGNYYLWPTVIGDASMTSDWGTISTSLANGRLRVAPLDLTNALRKGNVVESIVPSDVLGNASPEEMRSALPADVLTAFKAKLTTVASVVGRALNPNDSAHAPSSGTVLGPLAIENKAQSKPKPVSDLWIAARRGVNLFVASPIASLQTGVPVMGDSSVLTSLMGGATTALNTGDMGTPSLEATAKRAARVAGGLLRQRVMDKLTRYWPPPS